MGLTVRTGSWMGPAQGERALRVGPIRIVILSRERWDGGVGLVRRLK